MCERRPDGEEQNVSVCFCLLSTVQCYDLAIQYARHLYISMKTGSQRLYQIKPNEKVSDHICSVVEIRLQDADSVHYIQHIVTQHWYMSD